MRTKRQVKHVRSKRQKVRVPQDKIINANGRNPNIIVNRTLG
jgi:hypothetical protein